MTISAAASLIKKFRLTRCSYVAQFIGHFSTFTPTSNSIRTFAPQREPCPAQTVTPQDTAMRLLVIALFKLVNSPALLQPQQVAGQ